MTFDEEVNVASKWEEEVSRLYDLALSKPGKANGGNLALTNAVVSEFLSATDIDVSDFSYVLRGC